MKIRVGSSNLLCMAALLGLAALTSQLSGCATAAKSDAMVAQPATLVHKSGTDVSVAVVGGQETSSMGASQISNANFAQALSESISQSGLFAKVADANGHYKLTAFIGKVDQPMMGFSMTVKMEVNYTLLDTTSGKTVWTKNVASTYTASASAAFAGTTRLRLANEGAAKDNIQQAITDISTLNL
jgi:hypothetical protein